MLLVVMLFQEEVGVGREEYVRQLLHRHHRDRVPVLGAEAAEQIEHLARLTNRLTHITKSIGQLLEAPSVLGDVHVTLHQVPELGF
jgi:hypothetical protein